MAAAIASKAIGFGRMGSTPISPTNIGSEEVLMRLAITPIELLTNTSMLVCDGLIRMLGASLPTN